MFLLSYGATALAGLLIGLRIGKRHASRAFIGSLAFATVCFIAYAALRHYAEARDLYEPYRVARAIGPGFLIGLYFAAGLSGPALLRSAAGAVTLSIGAIGIALTLGTYVIMWLTCMFAGDCP